MATFDKHLPEQILRKEDMEWNVSGLFAHDNDIIAFINIVQKELGAKNPISSRGKESSISFINTIA